MDRSNTNLWATDTTPHPIMEVRTIPRSGPLTDALLEGSKKSTGWALNGTPLTDGSRLKAWRNGDYRLCTVRITAEGSYWLLWDDDDLPRKLGGKGGDPWGWWY